MDTGQWTVDTHQIVDYRAKVGLQGASPRQGVRGEDRDLEVDWDLSSTNDSFMLPTLLLGGKLKEVTLGCFLRSPWARTRRRPGSSHLSTW